jgi:hypothetical protein
MQCFFDVHSPRSKLYDFQGRYFDKLENAAEVAKLIALDLANSNTENWDGAQIEVRNVTGDTLFSVPVLNAA